MRFLPYQHYKETGEQWLDQIPEHWEAKRLKYVASVNDEALGEDVAADLEILYVDIGSVDFAEGITRKEAMVFEDAPSRARRRVEHGDTIVSTVRTYLKAIARVEHPESNLIVSTGFAVIRPRKINSRFLGYCLRSGYFVQSIVSRSVGVSYPAINASEILTIPIPVPPLEEQETIANYLDKKTLPFSRLLSKLEHPIPRVSEYRDALIMGAVTGRFDLRQEML